MALSSGEETSSVWIVIYLMKTISLHKQHYMFNNPDTSNQILVHLLGAILKYPDYGETACGSFSRHGGPAHFKVLKYVLKKLLLYNVKRMQERFKHSTTMYIQKYMLKYNF